MGGFEELALVGEAAARCGLSIERLERLNPIDLPLRSESLSLAISVILEGGGTPGSPQTADVEYFMQELRAMKKSEECFEGCNVLLERHEMVSKPGFSKLNF